jgi:hypothetical protein
MCLFEILFPYQSGKFNPSLMRRKEGWNLSRERRTHLCILWMGFSDAAKIVDCFLPLAGGGIERTKDLIPR